MSYKLPTKAIITDAGFASRFLPLTKTTPKAMIPIGSKPVMQYVVEECIEAGITEIIIVATKDGKPTYEDYFENAITNVKKLLKSQGKPERYAPVEDILNFPKITVIEQDSALPYGNGSPVASARKFIKEDESFIVCFSDDMVFGENSIKALIETYTKNPDATAIVATQRMPQEELSKYGVVKLKDGTNDLETIVEKPAVEDAPSDLVAFGRYLVTPDIFKYLRSENIGREQELWFADAIESLIKNDNARIIAEVIKGEWITTGDPRNYFLAQLKYVLEHEKYADDVRSYVQNH